MSKTKDDKSTATTKPSGAPDVSVTPEGEDDLKDVSTSELPDYEGTPAVQMTEEIWPDRVVTIQEQGIGPKDPYPTGDPPLYGNVKQDDLDRPVGPRDPYPAKVARK
jgi:hypothetical protein